MTAATGGASASVLVVDGREDFAPLLAGWLRADGHRVAVARSGEEARQHVAQAVPDLILLDVLLPDGNGFDLCRGFKSAAATLQVPIVLVTSADARDEHRRGIEAGCDEFLARPVDRHQLGARVRSLLQLQAARRALEAERMARETARRDALRRTALRYVAPGLVQRILDAGSGSFMADEGSHHDAVVLFADMRGFTRMTGSLPPPVVVRILNRFFTILTEAAHRHGGTVFDMAGDCLLVGFGVPLAAADMERRALCAACDIMDDARALEIECEEEHGVQIAVGIGVNRGEVIAGNVGAPSHMNYTVVGDTVNVAARLKDVARPGEILIAQPLQRTAEDLQPRLTDAHRYEVALKGKAKPVHAFGWRASPPASRLRPMIINESAELRALVRQFIRIEWPDAEITGYDPVALGQPAADFDWSRHNVLLLDDGPGEHDGLAWLQAFRGRPGLPPVVFLSGSGNEALAARAIQAGAAECLSTNDLSRARLAEAIREAVAGHVVAAHPPADGPAFDARVSPRGEHEAVSVGDYRVLQRLGDGGMAVVYLAEHMPTGEQRVLKILDTRTTRSPEFLERFIHEYGLVSHIASPYVVRIHDQGVANHHAYIAMEYLPGGDLKSRIGQGLPPAVAMRVFRELLRALRAIHGAGIVHRDLKPHNIMFRGDGTLVLVDFGIATQMAQDEALAQAGIVLGTPLYMSPEQAAGLDVDGRADLYSAGVILYEMLTGQAPFRAKSPAGLVHEHRYAAVPDLPAELSDFVPLLARLLAKDRDQRPQSAQELLLGDD